MILANDGISIECVDSKIVCSNGESYELTGSILMGPCGVASMGMDSMTEAVGIVIGMHGGKRS